MQSDLNSANAELAEKNETISTMQETINNNASTISSLQSANAELTAQAEEDAQTISINQATITELETSNAGYESDIAGYEAQIEELQGQVISLQNQLTNYQIISRELDNFTISYMGDWVRFSASNSSGQKIVSNDQTTITVQDLLCLANNQYLITNIEQKERFVLKQDTKTINNSIYLNSRNYWTVHQVLVNSLGTTTDIRNRILQLYPSPISFYDLENNLIDFSSYSIYKSFKVSRIDYTICSVEDLDELFDNETLTNLGFDVDNLPYTHSDGTKHWFGQLPNSNVASGIIKDIKVYLYE